MFVIQNFRMIRSLLYGFLTLNFMFSMGAFSFAQQTLQWEFYHPIKKMWLPFGEKGSIQEKLIANGEIPNPFYGTNEEKLDWIEDFDWELRSKFYLSEEEFNTNSLELYFPNLDTYVQVFVNGNKVYTAENYHHPHAAEIRPFVQCGYNEVKLVFTPPVRYFASRYKEESFHFPAPNDVHKTKIAPLARKPQYQFGWDWALRINTLGLQKPAQVRLGKSNAFLGVSVSTKEIYVHEAMLSFAIQLKNNKEPFVLMSEYLGVIEPEDAVEKEGVFQIDVKISEPKYWWPIGFGDQAIYTDTLRLFDKKHNLLDEKVIHFGIRKVELIQNKDSWGTSFVLQINEIPIFCKGADYIPQSVFPSAVNESDLQEMVAQMTAANFNMVRVWGGGYYPDDAFFEACDKAGIMVWQDLMFACAMYPGDDAFLKEVEKELQFQMPRITSHPSVVLINGNNEVDVAWKNWGFQSQYHLNEEAQKTIAKAYDDLFKQLAPSVLKRYSRTPYEHTSPLSNWGKDEFYNHGTQHYWGVWHGKDPMSDFGKKIGRFNAEYGFQSFPEFSTIRRFADSSDWNLHSKVMKSHQKSYVGNGMIEKHAELLYGKPKNFEQFVYFSQLTQAYAVSLAVSGHRLDAPRCSGTLYWQLNDCWPAPTWSSIDFYGNWKALHYAVREDYRQIAILKHATEKGSSLYLKSDALKNQKISVTVTVKDLKGKVLKSQTFEKEMVYQGKELLTDCKENDVVYTVQLSDGYERSFLFSNKKEFPKGKVKIELKSVNLKDKTAEIIVTNELFCANFWLYSAELGVRFDKNFCDLLPGQHVFKISFSKEPQLNDFGFMSR